MLRIYFIIRVIVALETLAPEASQGSQDKKELRGL